jgi:hypothetical protein
MLCHRLGDHGTTPDGRLFRGARGGILSESVYGRAWHAACQAALGPDLAATALARRPYDLRHAALSLWLNATGEPAEVAARADTSTRVMHDVYVHCIDTREDAVSQRIEDALDPGASVAGSSRCGKASGYTHRRHHPDPVRHMYANYPEVPRTAHGHRARATRDTACRHPPSRVFPQLRWHLKQYPRGLGDARIRPTHSPRDTADGQCNRSLSAEKPVTQSGVTGSDLRRCVAGVGFEPT